jgi:hypothetical protein
VPMSYLYGIRFKMQENDLIRSLREARITTAGFTFRPLTFGL